MIEHEIPINNPAGRLVILLKKAIDIGKMNGDKLYISHICEATGIKDTAGNRVESLSNLFYLIHQVEKDLPLLTKIKAKNHKKTITELKTFVASYYMKKYLEAQQLNNINSYIIRDLEICADSLSEVVELKVLEEEELERIIDDIGDLYSSINKSNIGQDLKFLLLKKLDSLKEVIDNYQFQGSDGIKREVENIVGSIALNKKKVKNEEEANLVKKLFELLCKVLTTASAVKNLLPEGFSEIAQNLLKLGQ